MSISEGIKSLLKSTLDFAQWVRFNLNSCIEIGHNTKVRGAVLSQNVKIGSHCNIQRGGSAVSHIWEITVNCRR